MPTRGINKVILIGNVGQDPQIKTFQNGEQLASLSIATSESWRDRNTGETREKVEWHRVEVFGVSAQFVANYVKKGSQVYIEGQLQTRKWQDQMGNDRFSTEVVVRWPNGNIQLVGARVEAGVPNNTQSTQSIQSNLNPSSFPAPYRVDEEEVLVIPF